MILTALFGLLAVAVHAGWWREFDLQLMLFLHDWTNPTLDWLASILDLLGLWEVTTLAIAAFAVWRWRGGNRRAAVVLSIGYMILVATGVGLKQIVSQPPPDAMFGRFLFDIRVPSMDAAALIGAYPSGHVARFTAALVLMALVARRTPLHIATAGAILIIAWSRMYLGAHWFTDVAGGVLLGSIAALIAMTLISVGSRDGSTSPAYTED